MTSRKIFLRQEMRRYLRTVPDATPDEIAELKAWVDQGNDPYSNLSHVTDSCDWELPFIHGIRAEQITLRQYKPAWLIPPNPALNPT